MDLSWISVMQLAAATPNSNLIFELEKEILMFPSHRAPKSLFVAQYPRCFLGSLACKRSKKTQHNFTEA
jgi:hypothetical protein